MAGTKGTKNAVTPLLLLWGLLAVPNVGPVWGEAGMFFTAVRAEGLQAIGVIKEAVSW